jgi:hypothetical protein
MSSVPSSAEHQNRKPGVCFSCGKPGHWRYQCLTARSATDSATTFAKQDFTKISKYSKPEGSVRVKTKNVNSDLNVSSSMFSVKTVLHRIITPSISVGNITQIGCLNSVSNVNSPVGRLKASLPKWKVTGVNPFILSY